MGGYGIDINNKILYKYRMHNLNNALKRQNELAEK